MGPDRWLLIRGLSRERRHWGEFPDVFGSIVDADVRTIDPPGFGAEHQGTSPARIDAITDDIAARLGDDLTDGSWGILGISLGGMVALDWCARRPDDFTHLVVVNSSARPSRPWHRFRPGTVPALLGARRHPGDAAERATLEVSVNRTDHDLDALAATYTAWAHECPPSSASLRNQIVAATRFRTPAAVATPTLIVTSKGDRLVSSRCSVALADTLGASLRIHPDGGHDLALDDGPWIGQTVRDWLEASP